MVGIFNVARLEKYVLDTEEKILPMMKDARRKYLKYGDALVAFRDHIVNVIKVVKEVIRLSMENEKLRAELGQGQVEKPRQMDLDMGNIPAQEETES